MSLDGVFLHCITSELQVLVGAKVDKVYQPSTEELIISLRTRGAGGKKLLLSARANSPRLSLTDASFENPAVPPMLCMLLRKRLGGATLTAVSQQGCDRIAYIDFLATNEMGDKENLRLVIEIMAQYSNVIFLDSDGKIIDALKRVDYTKSSVRLVLPGVAYELPPAQDKVNLFEDNNTKTAALTMALSRINEKLENGKDLYSALMASILGISPIVARELAFRIEQSTSSGQGDVKSVLETFVNEHKDGSPEYYLLKDESGKPFEFSFIRPTQYGDLGENLLVFDTASELLDEYYAKRDSMERMAHKTSDLRKLLSNIKERTSRKIDNQKVELEACADREKLRIYAELINANLYKLKQGPDVFELENYYDDNKLVCVPVSPALTPAQNSQKYFKDYKKTYTAEKKLTEQIEFGAEELLYIDSVIDELSRAESEKDISAIKEELKAGGYIRNKGKEKLHKNGKKVKEKPTQSLPPIAYMTTDGYKVLVGRNNIQNDKLSLKTAAKLDMWLHTKDFPGSHVIIESKDGEVSDDAIVEAAIIAAVNSTAREAAKVPVNYTQAKNLKKPTGAKPGKVIYHVYNTVYVSPDPEFAERQRVK